MNATERIKSMLSGKQIDRVGASAWLHCNLIDHDVKEFTRRTVEFQECNDWDFIKMMYSQFHFVEDFDCKIEWSTPQYPYPKMLRYPVDDICDWDNMRYISGRDGALAQVTEVTKRVVDRFKGRVPTVATVFSPFTNAAEMTGGYFRQSIIVAQARYHPEIVERALQRLTDITIAFCDELVKAGVDGVFFADQFASTNLLTWEEHDHFVKRYDLQILEYLKGKTWFNMVHVHGTSNLMMDKFYDYPVQAINWEDVVSGVSMADARAKTDKILIGGIEQNRDLLPNTRDELADAMRRRVERAYAGAGEKLIFAPGCAIPHNLPEYKLHFIREAVEQLSR